MGKEDEMLTSIKRFFNREVDMLEGPIVKGLLAIAMPVMIMNVISSMFNIVDMAVLKEFGNDGYTVGAVGVCGYLISLITGLLIGCAAGANVVVARHIGRGDRDSVSRTVGTTMFFALIGGIMLTVIGVSLAEVFLRLMNCPEELLPNAVLYFRLYFLGVPLIMLYTFAHSILRSTGNTTAPMIQLIIGAVVKLVFTVILVAVFKLSVLGVALASIISWIVTAAMALRSLIADGGTAKLEWRHFRIYSRELVDVLRIGVPAGLQQALYSVANVIISTTVNSFGPAATTGISIANNFDGILYQISMAPGYAVLPYISQNVGKGNIKRSKQAIIRAMGIVVALGATFGALSAIFSAELSSIMSSDPEVIAFSQQKMIIVSSTYFICGINEVMGASLRGLGKPIIPTVSTLIFMCLFRFVWVYLIFPLCPNLTFLYLVWPVGWTLSIITLLIFYFPTVKKLEEAIMASSTAQGATE